MYVCVCVYPYNKHNCDVTQKPRSVLSMGTMLRTK